MCQFVAASLEQSNLNGCATNESKIGRITVKKQLIDKNGCYVLFRERIYKQIQHALCENRGRKL